MSRLLVYTPDEKSGKALCELLRRRKFSPVFLASIDMLVEKIRFGAGDLVVLDILSISSIHKDLRDFFAIVNEIPVIILTPYGNNEKELHSLQKQGYHLLIKPIAFEELVNLIQKLLGQNS